MTNRREIKLQIGQKITFSDDQYTIVRTEAGGNRRDMKSRASDWQLYGPEYYEIFETERAAHHAMNWHKAGRSTEADWEDHEYMASLSSEMRQRHIASMGW